MNRPVLFLLFLLSFTLLAKENPTAKTIHVFVALCDNENQGIVPVSAKLGNGQSPNDNLYWGALYGVKTYFNSNENWTFVKSLKTSNPKILERILFKNKTSNIYMLADAYDGRYIKQATIDFLKASGGDELQTMVINNHDLVFGGGSELVAYIGHDGLMEFDIEEDIYSCDSNKDAIILACVSKHYFSPYLNKTNANPLVWTTGLMAPEAYTLNAAIDGWILNETDQQIKERAAQAYHKYQKSGIRGARNLLVTGY